MLYLTRHENEGIAINNEIEIMVINIMGKQIKLGISAPKNYDIKRICYGIRRNQMLENNSNGLQINKNRKFKQTIGSK